MGIISLVVRCGNVSKNIAYISMQSDGSLSLGSTDKNFLVPDFQQSTGVWSLFNRQKLVFAADDNPSLSRVIRNPHFTYHPAQPPRHNGDTFHINIGNNRPKLIDVIFPLDLMLNQDGYVEWTRIVTRRASELPDHRQTTRNKEAPQVLEWYLESLNVSLGVGIDFLRRDISADAITNPDVRRIPYRHTDLAIFLRPLPLQNPTLIWHVQH